MGGRSDRRTPRAVAAVATVLALVGTSLGLAPSPAFASTVPISIQNTVKMVDPLTRLFAPAGIPGDTLVITGAGLTPFTGTPNFVEVQFTGDPATYHAKQTSPTTFSVVVPAGATSGPLQVADNAGNTASTDLQIWASHSEPYIMPSGHLNITAADLQFILDQIKMAEAHSARTATPAATLVGSPTGTIRYPYDVTSATRCLQAADIDAAGTTAFGATGLSNVYPFSTNLQNMWGLRQVDGQCNNISNVTATSAPTGTYLAPNLNASDSAGWGASDQLFQRLAPATNNAAAGATYTLSQNQKAYQSPSSSVKDATPRLISNLIADQSLNNPAAVSVSQQDYATLYPGTKPKFQRAVNATTGAVTKVASIPDITPDYNVSAGYNSWFTLFGQFFDHGLDLIPKGGTQVYIPLSQSDPLYVASPTAPNFMILTRGAESKYNGDSVNITTPYVDQSQTYGSHPSQNFFLREYSFSVTGVPTSDGRLLEGTDTAYASRLGGADLPAAWAGNLTVGGTLTNPGSNGDTANHGMPTWREVKAQARLLGIGLTDTDADNIPVVATDQYGNFIANPSTGMPLMLFTDGSSYAWASGTAAAPLSTGKPTPGNTSGGTSVPGLPGNGWRAVLTGHAFINDTMNSAVPLGTVNHVPNTPLQPDADTILDSPLTATAPGTYDDENLDAHFVAGDGRINENIGLQAVHNVFHSEHNLVQNDIVDLLTKDPALTAGFVDEWKASDGSWNGSRLFQAARVVTEMEYQHMVFGEFIRRITPALPLFVAYDPTINAGISNEFASAVYRLGHSMLNETIARSNPGKLYDPADNQDVSLITGFTNPIQARLPRPATVASATASGSDLTYTLAAGESAPKAGEIVSVKGMVDTAYDVTNAVVDSATSTTFTVSTYYPGGSAASATAIPAPAAASTTSKQSSTADVTATDATGASVVFGDTSASSNIATVSINDPGAGGAANLYSPEEAIAMTAQGMSSQRGQEVDEFMTDATRNNLLGLPLDLASLNLTRGRDVGLPKLNQFREQDAAALPPYANWADYGLALRYPESLTNFVAAYGTHPTITSAVTVADITAVSAVDNASAPGTATVTYDYTPATGKTVHVGDQVTVTGLSDYNVSNGVVSAATPTSFTVATTMNSGNQDVKSYGSFSALMADNTPVPVPFTTSTPADGTGIATREPTVDERRAAAQALLDKANNNDNSAPDHAVDFISAIGTWAGTETGINDVDLWIGGLAENPLKQPVTPPLFGSTFERVFDEQALKLQNGDRFYYLGRLSGTTLGEEIPAQLFTDIVKRNTPVAQNKGTLGMTNPGFSVTDCWVSNNAALVPGSTDPFSEAPVKCGGMSTSAKTGTLIHTGLDNVTVFGDPTTTAPAKLSGGAGDDSLQGGPGNDSLSGGTSGGDTIEGFAGNDNLQGGPGEDLIQGGSGDDNINAGENQVGDTVDGGSGNDTITNGNSLGAFASAIGETGDDFIAGGKGSDLLLEGGEGNDWVEGNADADIITGDLNLVGNGDQFQIAGGNDVINGGPAADVIFGGGGDDVVLSGDGADVIDTGNGFDWLNYEFSKRLDNGGTKPSAYVDGTGALFPNPNNQTGDVFLNTEAFSGTKNNDVLIGSQGADVTITGVKGQAGTAALVLPGLVTTVVPGMAVSGPGIAPNTTTIAGAASQVVNGVTTTVVDISTPNTANIVNGTITFSLSQLTNPGYTDGLTPLLQNTPGWLKFSTVTPGSTSWSGGSILLGGGGSDALQPVAGENVLDGSNYLNTCILVKGGAYTTGADVPQCGAGKGFSTFQALNAALDAGTLVPGDLQTIQEIKQSAVPVTSVSSTATTATYTVGSNPFSVGDSVTVRDLSLPQFDVLDATVTATTSTTFTVALAGTPQASTAVTGWAKATDTLRLPLAANQYTLLPVSPLPAGVLTGVQVVSLDGQTIDTVYDVDMVSYAGAAAVPFTANGGQLRSLTSSVGTFSPAFVGTTLAYQLGVPAGTTSLTLTPTVDNPGTKVTINGAPVASGAASGPVALTPGGPNVITIVGTPPSTNAAPSAVHPAIPATTYTVTVLIGGLTPTFSGVTSNPTGFTVNVTNYDPAYTWAGSTTTAGATVTLGAPNGATLPLSVTGLTVGQSADVTITTDRTGYTQGSATTTGTALNTALTPTLTPAAATADGFTSSITNYDPAFTWAATSTAGTAVIGTAIGATAPITVTGLVSGQTATVTVTTVRTGYQPGSAQVTGAATASGAALTPTFGPVTPTATGFTVPITDYNAAWQWAATPTAGTATVGANGVLTVTGLTLGQSSTVTVTTTRVGYQTGTANISGTATATGTAPTFGAVTRTTTGFRVAVTNYSAVSTYAFSPTAGSAAWQAAAVGTSRTLVVTGLTPGQSSTVTVTVSRTGYTDGVGSVTGSALAAGVVPTFGPVAPRADGFRVSVTNYSASSTYTLTTNRGQVAWLSAASGGTRRLAVTGLALGQSATVTVRVAKSGSTTVIGTVTGTAALVVAAPTLTGVARNSTGTRLTATIGNYSSNNTYACSAVRTSGGTAIGSCSVNVTTRVVTVTGLTAAVRVNLTVTASRTGWLPGKVTVTNV